MGNVALVMSAPNGSQAATPAERPRGPAPGRLTLDAMRTHSTTVFLIDSLGTPVWQASFPGERVLPIGVGLLARPRYGANSFVEMEIMKTPISKAAAAFRTDKR